MTVYLLVVYKTDSLQVLFSRIFAYRLIFFPFIVKLSHLKFTFKTPFTMAKNRHSRLCDPTQWVDLHGNYLYHFALGRLRNPELAENAVQETFLAALEGKEKFSGRSSERTWLSGILKHKIVDHFRKKYREVDFFEIP